MTPPSRDRRPRGRATTDAASESRADIPRRPFGRTRELVSALGLGGWHLGLCEREADAVRLVHAAIDAGITFLDNAWEYHDGRSEHLMGRAIADRRQRVFLMTKVCTHGRHGRVALRQLEESLRRLRTDYLDLWQIHECVYANDPELHFARGGVVDAVQRAQEDGKVRFTGFTGHKDPDILLRMLAHGFPFDSCQLPLNAFDATFRSFERYVLPELKRQGISALGMKPFGGDATMLRRKAITPEEALRYAMSLPVATTITGIDSRRILRQNARIAAMPPFTAREMTALRRRVAVFAADGRFELYKTSALFEGPEGRRQHGFPPQEELVL
jgi:uncharacterized protein